MSQPLCIPEHIPASTIQAHLHRFTVPLFRSPHDSLTELSFLLLRRFKVWPSAAGDSVISLIVVYQQSRIFNKLYFKRSWLKLPLKLPRAITKKFMFVSSARSIRLVSMNCASARLPVVECKYKPEWASQREWKASQLMKNYFRSGRTVLQDH